jgi:hypothetical protein
MSLQIEPYYYRSNTVYLSYTVILGRNTTEKGSFSERFGWSMVQADRFWTMEGGEPCNELAEQIFEL